MKSNAGPGAIAIAIIALLVVVFALYRYAFGGHNNQPPITPDNRPEYVKKLQRGEATDYYGHTPPGATTKP